MPGTVRRSGIEYTAWVLASLLGFSALRITLGYPIFHMVAELYAVTVAIAAFMIAWNARAYLENGYLLVLGIAFFFIGAVDVMHALSYQGMDVLTAYSSTEVPTQLWLVGRYIQVAAVLTAPLLVRRKPSPYRVFAAFFALTALLLAAVFSGVFPSALPEGGSLTPFKIWSEWAIIAAFAVSLIALRNIRQTFDQRVYRLLGGFIVAGIVAEFMFTLYTSPDSLANMTGHLVRILAYFLLYRAIVETGIRQPYAMLYREFAEADELLRGSEERFRATFEQASIGIAHVSLDGNWMLFNRKLAEITGYPPEKLREIPPAEITHTQDRDAEETLISRLLSGEINEYRLEKRYVRPDGLSTWVNVSRTIVRGDDGSPRHFAAVIEDISARKSAEDRLRQARDLAETLNAIDRAVSSTLDADEIMRRAAALGSAAFNADTATIWLREGDKWIPRLAFGYPDFLVGTPLDSEAVPHITLAAETLEPVAVTDAQAEYPDAPFVHMAHHTIQSVLAIPLRHRDEQFGALSFVWQESPHIFTSGERDFARKLGSVLALAMDNARLYQAQANISETLQASMLRMDAAPEGVAVAATYRSVTELTRIGGDFFDLFALDDGTVAFVIGDVAGKGLDAASLTSIAKSTLRAFAYVLKEPVRVAEAANRSLSQQVEEGRFITAVYGTLDPATGHLRMVCAGHPLPIVCDERGCTDYDAPRNPPLGIFPEQAFESCSLELSPGSRLVLFTDGLLDARRTGSEFFGEARVREVLDGLGDADPSILVNRLLESATDFSQGSPGDDIAILALRFLGTK